MKIFWSDRDMAFFAYLREDESYGPAIADYFDRALTNIEEGYELHNITAYYFEVSDEQSDKKGKFLAVFDVQQAGNYHSLIRKTELHAVNDGLDKGQMFCSTLHHPPASLLDACLDAMVDASRAIDIPEATARAQGLKDSFDDPSTPLPWNRTDTPTTSDMNSQEIIELLSGMLEGLGKDSELPGDWQEDNA